MEQLAINLYDLDRLDPDTRQKLLKGRVSPNSRPIKMDWDRKDAKDEVAILLEGSLLENALCCDIIRDLDVKAGDFPTRLYIKRQEWSRIPSGLRLTIITGEPSNWKTKLNPDIFKIEALPLTPPKLKKRVL